MTYYAAWPLLGGAPTAVFRFFDDAAKTPERYTKDAGWITDYRLLLKQMSGDLGPADMISEEEALQIINRLNDRG